MIISIIAAVSVNNVIGKNNALPWHLPDDMKYFMQMTKGHYVIMGRKNYQSLPQKFQPLPNRTNIIVSSQNLVAPDCLVVSTIKEALAVARQNNESEAFLIGGHRIYMEGLPLADKLYLTQIHSAIDGDVYFPTVNWQEWTEISRTQHLQDARHLHSFDFMVFVRNRPVT